MSTRIADALRALADAVDAELGGHRDAGELLDLAALRARYSLGRDGILAAVGRGEIVASRGARGRILVARAEIERWLASRPVTARPRARKDAGVTDLTAWSRRQERELERMRGRR